MPSLPSKSRRKGITPFKKANQEHVWKSTLDYLGVEPMISDSTFNKAVGEAPTTMASPSQKMTLGGLPAEILKAIFQDSPSPDLVALSLVSKQFHTIAAEHLYRTFHIVFPDEDDPLNDALIDGLAAGLDTFATSEYDYAAHLREIILETVSGDVGRERSYRHYLFDVSCGKFMSTLLALTLRKAKSLETFRWDIRVELSRPVFKTLHNIDALQNLHLRMHAGPSLYLAPPDLNSSTTPSSTNQTYVQINGSHIAPISTSKSFKNGSKQSTEAQSNTLKKLLPPTKAAPPTLSGFKHLKSLSILDMDTLEYIDELNTCVRNCSSSLKILKLSFSEALANRSRKPPPEPQSDSESDPEGLDQFQGMPPPGIPNMPLPNPLAGASDPNGPIRVLKAQQEKKRQEAALGRILGRAPVLKPSTVEAIEFSEKAYKELAKDPRRRFIEKLTPVAAKLMGHIKPKSEDTPAGKKALELIKKAANMYLDSIDKDQASAGSSTAKETPPSSPTTNGEEIIMTDAIEPGLFDDKPEPKSKSDETGVSNPDDIDMDEPEVKDSDVEEEAKLDPDQDAKAIRTAHQEMTADIQEMRRQYKEDTAGMDEHHPLRPLGVKLLAEIEQLEGLLVVRDQQKSIENAHAMEAEIDAQMASVVAESLNFSRDLRSYLQSLKQEAKELLTVDTMSEYVRNTHGLTLDSLAIYLLPIKASVLGRAIDFTTLRSITLLHVGTQVPFWTFMEKMNKESPLPLSRIHSDHVSSSLLHFVAELKRPEELYFIERDPKLSRVEITAPKTNVKIDQIRKIVLKKHAGNLKVFLLRNAKADWNLDTKTVTLLCQKGKQLEELAASFGLPAIHTFMQHMPGLTSLRVFHAINIVYNDECPFINTQFRKFMLDICTHIPELKLEYMASLDSVERLVRRKAVPKVRKGSDKGKEKATATHIDDALGNIWANYPDPNISPISTGSGWTASGSISSPTGQPAEFPDSSDDEDDLKPATKIETVGDIKYQEVIGVKIWEKEVVSNRL